MNKKSKVLSQEEATTDTEKLSKTQNKSPEATKPVQ